MVGLDEGITVGKEEGSLLATIDGLLLGLLLKNNVGAFDSILEGSKVNIKEGIPDLFSDNDDDGSLLILLLGFSLEPKLGRKLG